MPYDHDVLAELDEQIDALEGPTVEEVYDAVLPYEPGMVAASAVKRALAGGGGGVATGVATPDASGDDSDSITIRTGDSDSDDSGDITIITGDGDDGDGDVLIQGVVTVHKNGVQVIAPMTFFYDDGQLEVSDGGGGIGVLLNMVGVATINRGDPEAYPDIGGNYILIVKDPSTQLTWGVTPAGYEYFSNATAVGAPDDADIDAFQRRQWYDPTSGAPAFRFKQKDADGTVTEGKAASLSTDGTEFLGVEKPSVGTADGPNILAALVALGLVTDDT